MPVSLTQQDLAELQQEGYSPQEIQQAIMEVEREESMQRKGVSLEQEYAKSRSYGAGGSYPSSVFQYNPTDNLVKWQLELNDILERAEHILREDIVLVKNGRITWQKNPNQKGRIFNEYGVQEIMRILSMYINRNTILSDYEPDEISDKVFDFGKEVNDLVFMKYREFGMTDLEKRKNYPMLLREIIDIVHSAYKRALYGGERESLRTARQISQSEQLMPQGINIQTGEVRKERGILNPFRYAVGKYK